MSLSGESGKHMLNVSFRFCEGFRMPAVHERAAGTGGRRPKTSKGGNRVEGTVMRPRWLWGFERRKRGVLRGGETMQRDFDIDALAEGIAAVN